MAFGRLFTEDFLREGVDASTDWKALDQTLEDQRAALRVIFDDFQLTGAPNEAETEERLVYKVTDVLGWTAKSVQQAVECGRREIPGTLLLLDPEHRTRAEAIRGPETQHRADVILAAKRWGLALDKASGCDTPPSAQLLDYLSRAETQPNGRILLGVLTNGRIWRLYWRRAKSLLTDYFEIDLAAALGVMDADDLFGPQSDADRERDLKLFLLFFSRDAFDASKRTPARTFHEHALEQGRFREARVTERLREVVFDTVFPGFMRALKDADKDAPHPLTPDYLDTLREATFTYLYRLLFTLYAEDRDLLPESHARTDDYPLSKQGRDEVALRLDAGDTLSARNGRLYRSAWEMLRLIEEGGTSVGMPPHHDVWFRPERAPLLGRVEIPDRVFAPLLDALSRAQKDGQRFRVSYRDLSALKLGSIYERLLEYETVADPAAPSGIAIRLDPVARKGAGSDETPDEMIEPIVARTRDPLVQQRIDAFRQQAEALASKHKSAIEAFKALYADEAANIVLEFRPIDPAAGGRNTLISLEDFMAREASRRDESPATAPPDGPSRWPGHRPHRGAHGPRRQ